MGVGGQRYVAAALPPRKRACTHCTEGWVGSRADLERCGISRHTPEFDPRIVRPVASGEPFCFLFVKFTFLQFVSTGSSN